MFMMIAPIAGWSAGTSGKSQTMIGLSARPSRCTSPARSASRIRPSHRIMMAKSAAASASALLAASIACSPTSCRWPVTPPSSNRHGDKRQPDVVQHESFCRAAAAVSSAGTVMVVPSFKVPHERRTVILRNGRLVNECLVSLPVYRFWILPLWSFCLISIFRLDWLQRPNVKITDLQRRKIKRRAWIAVVLLGPQLAVVVAILIYFLFLRR